MADLGTIRGKINGLPAELRPVFLEIFTEILTQLRFGHPKGEQPDACQNFAAGFFDVTSAAIAGKQFTFTHGFGHAPYLAIPVLPLDVEGAQIVPVTVDRVADDGRVYLTSTATNVPLTFYVEG